MCLQLTNCPETSDTVGKKESQKGSANATNLHHRRHITLDIGVGIIAKFIEAKKFLEVGCVEGSCSKTISVTK